MSFSLCLWGALSCMSLDFCLIKELERGGRDRGKDRQLQHCFTAPEASPRKGTEGELFIFSAVLPLGPLQLDF